ncbi:MAG TPA: hypothetical protein VMA72_24925 [Streptosporangiaceae bacterium]|nr:hypothetical protein [Streptosporangiaceae bacterium]
MAGHRPSTEGKGCLQDNLDPRGERRLSGSITAVIGVRRARHNNLRDVDVDVPLWRTVAVVRVPGSGKTSLAMGTLYAEGMQRFRGECRRQAGRADSRDHDVGYRLFGCHAITVEHVPVLAG